MYDKKVLELGTCTASRGVQNNGMMAIFLSSYFLPSEAIKNGNGQGVTNPFKFNMNSMTLIESKHNDLSTFIKLK